VRKLQLAGSDKAGRLGIASLVGRRNAVCGTQKDAGCRDNPDDEAQRRGGQITRPSVLISYGRAGQPAS
jgi:hypothetical protein